MLSKARAKEKLKALQRELIDVLGRDFLCDLPDLISVSGPLVDVYENDREVVAVIEIPGMSNRENIKISLFGDYLHISGIIEKKYEAEEIFRAERFGGPFNRKIFLPSKVKKNAVMTKYKNGLLEIRMVKELELDGEDLTINFD